MLILGFDSRHACNRRAGALASIGSPTAIKKWGADAGLHPVGAGPFKFDSLVANTSAVVVKNPGYAAYAPGQPYLDKITFKPVPETPVQLVSSFVHFVTQGMSRVTVSVGSS